MDTWSWDKPMDGMSDGLDPWLGAFDELFERESPNAFADAFEADEFDGADLDFALDDVGAFDDLLGNPADDVLSTFDTPHLWKSDGNIDMPTGFDSPLMFAEREWDDFPWGSPSGLFLPHQTDTLTTGPEAVMLSRALNSFVAGALPADDAEAFFKKIARSVRRVAGGLAGGAFRAVGRLAGPLLKRVLPIIQRVAGFAGPWGRLISAGLGAARGLIEGKGLKGALAGALSGALPGVGGKLASAVLRGDGADDDASLDALADMTDAGFAPAFVALPLGSGLATRVASRVGLGRVEPTAARPTEQWMMRLAVTMRGTPGERLRVLRSVSRVAALILRRRRQAAPIERALLGAARLAARSVLAQAQRGGGADATRGNAARRIALRRDLMNRLPISALSPRYPGFASAMA